MMQFCVLGTGSKGNATLIKTNTTTILIDAGFSGVQLFKKIQLAGIDLHTIQAILITHEHEDHTKAIGQIVKKRNIPVYSTRRTAGEIRSKTKHPVNVVCFEPGQTFKIGDIEITAFSVYHDALDPVGFKLTTDHSSLAIVSDTGHVPRIVADRLRSVHSLMLESNYDPDLLEMSKRPRMLKDRIASQHGHLSNEQACTLIGDIAAGGLKNLILIHLSEECNSPKIAHMFMQKTLQQTGVQNVCLHTSPQHNVMPWLNAY